MIVNEFSRFGSVKCSGKKDGVSGRMKLPESRQFEIPSHALYRPLYLREVGFSPCFSRANILCNRRRVVRPRPSAGRTDKVSDKV